MFVCIKIRKTTIRLNVVVNVVLYDHTGGKTCRKHVTMCRADTINWHDIWLSCGCPNEEGMFLILVKQLDPHIINRLSILSEMRTICRDKFSNELLSKDMRQFWRSVSDLRENGKRTSNIIDYFSNDVSKCFARSYENVLIKCVLTVLT